MKRSIIILSIVATSAAAFLPQAASARANVGIVVNVAPPPLRVEAVPGPRSGYFWVPGYWHWRRHGHVWISGHWELARTGYIYRPNEWVQDGRNWRLVEGGWVNAQAMPAAPAPQVEYQVAQPGQAAVVVTAPVAPPALRVERVPYARPGYVWAPGHWEWFGNRHEWIDGGWVAERPGHIYVPPVWVERGGRWIMEPGRWDRQVHREREQAREEREHEREYEREHEREHEREGMRDRDHDGVPDRVDRHPDNPRRD
jgi:hypothetical protein